MLARCSFATTSALAMAAAGRSCAAAACTVISSAQARRQAAPAPRFLWGLRIVIVVGVRAKLFRFSCARGTCNYLSHTQRPSRPGERHDRTTKRYGRTPSKSPLDNWLTTAQKNETRLVVKSAPRAVSPRASWSIRVDDTSPDKNS